MRWWILDTFFKKELLETKNNYQRKVDDIEKNAKKKTNMIELVHSILKEKNHVIVGEDINKMKEQVLVVQWVFDNDIWFMLYSERYKAINKHPRIMASYVSLYGEDPYIKIDDISVVDDDVGNGTILMPYFIKYCETTNAKYICGQLSSVDKGHFNRSEHFYKKHGFNVKFTSDRSSGSIKYILAEDTTESKK